MRIESASSPSYRKLLDDLAGKVVNKATTARLTARTRSAAFAPVTVRIAKKDVPLAMLAGLMWGGSFNLALATVINARLASLGSTESAKVQANLSGGRAFATVSIDEPPAPPPPAPPSTPWVAPQRDPATKTTFSGLCNDYGPFRHTLKTCAAEVLAYWSPESVAKDFEITHDELYYFFRHNTSLPYGTTLGVLRRILDAMHVRNSIAEPPAIEPEELAAAITALGESTAQPVVGSSATCAEIAAALPLHHGVVIKSCVRAALSIAVNYTDKFGITADKLVAFANGTQPIDRTEALAIVRKILTAVRDQSIYIGAVTFTPDEITAALTALDTPREHG